MAAVKLDLDQPNKMTIPDWVSGLGADDQLRRHFTALHHTDGTLAIQLRDAVLRQTAFIDKMNDHMWIRSPALSGTLTRAVDRYTKFLHLMKLYPTTMAVPTLDIDLVWHTHQCSPMRYFNATTEYTGRFINHDDTVVKGKLDDGFGITRGLFQVHFGKEYRICGCWDCEALMSALERPRRDAEGKPDMIKIVEDVEAQVTYFRAVEVARRRKRALPVQDQLEAD